MLEQKITVPTVGGSSGFTATQAYTYDSLNRLQSATETIGGGQTWKQTFSFDRYGNRRFDAANTTTLGSCTTAVCNPGINTSDNRFTSGQGYSYDANGNVMQDATSQRFTYDAENHQKEFFNASNPGSTPDWTYAYDGDGRRVKKVSATETTVFVYDATGKLVAEYATALATVQQVSYLTQDHLGSQRIVTNENGAVTDRKDYAAYGDETISAQRTSGVGYTTAQEPRKNYTGYEKDMESGLEFAQARFYNSTHGRYTSVDPMIASASIKNPQTFNRYSYVLNSPYKFVDPLGLISSSTGACGNWCSNSDSGGGGYSDSSENFLRAFEEVTINLNIVFDQNQYSLDQAKVATKDTVADLQKTYAEIGVKFNVTFTSGTSNTGEVNKDGVPARIATGFKDGAVNVFLFANSKYNGSSGSLYNSSSQQIFIWEGSLAEKPNAKNAANKLSSGALAHEVGHLFFHYAGLSMSETLANNISQDAGIGYSLNQMRYNPFFVADPELPDDFDYNKRGGGFGYTPPRKTKHNPTYEQLLRIGAKRLARHLGN